jgi:hypothetical protein
MKVIVAIPLVVAYVVAVFVGAPAVGPGAFEWLLMLLSALFVWAYLVPARGGPLVPLALVAVLTLLFPLAVLTWVGLPTHRTWWAALTAVFLSFRDHGSLWGLEIVFPIAGAAAMAFVTKRMKQLQTSHDTPSAL